MTNSPLISIIVPNYNHAQFLPRRLDSILNQTYANYELVFIDDASTDRSLAVIEDYKDQIDSVIINQTNSGSPFEQWRKGIEVAKGQWIWVAESDDYCEENFLEILVSRIEENIGLVYSQSFDVKGDQVIQDRIEYTSNFHPNIWEDDFQMIGDIFISRYMVEKNCIPNASAVIFRKDLLDEGFFDPEFLSMKMCGDWLFWVRLLVKTRISFAAKHLNYFRYHDSSSRNHNTLPKLKQRVSEEEIIRKEMKLLGVQQTKYLKNMELKWFKYFRFGERNSSEFESLNRSGLFPKLKPRFISYKLKKKFLG